MWHWLRVSPGLTGLLCALLLVVLSSGCVAKRRVITRRSGAPDQALQRVEKDALIARLATYYQSIKTINATVDMVPAIGSADKGKITEYKDIRAYILYRQPDDIRLIGLYPVVRNKAFDMVSDGNSFRLYLPAKNRFVTGQNAVTVLSKNKLENLRPQHFLDALVVRPSGRGEPTTLINLTDEDNAVYLLGAFDPAFGLDLRIRRLIWVERSQLQIVRQLEFDDSGDIVSDARYKNWQEYNGIPFPRTIELNRPKDEYGVVITIVKATINEPLDNAKFALEQPEGSTLQVLGAVPIAERDSK